MMATKAAVTLILPVACLWNQLLMLAAACFYYMDTVDAYVDENYDSIKEQTEEFGLGSNEEEVRMSLHRDLMLLGILLVPYFLSYQRDAHIHERQVLGSREEVRD